MSENSRFVYLGNQFPLGLSLVKGTLGGEPATIIIEEGMSKSFFDQIRGMRMFTELMIVDGFMDTMRQMYRATISQTKGRVFYPNTETVHLLTLDGNPAIIAGAVQGITSHMKPYTIDAVFHTVNTEKLLWYSTPWKGDRFHATVTQPLRIGG